MPLPPAAVYNSRDEAFKAIKEFAMQYGYAFRTGRSTEKSSTQKKVYYECDCAGKRPAQDREVDDPRCPWKRVRLTTTNKTPECTLSERVLLPRRGAGTNKWNRYTRLALSILSAA